jgi:tight adherence protein C
MTTTELALVGIAFLTAALGAMAALAQFDLSRLRRRLRVVGSQAAGGAGRDPNGWIESAVRLSGPFAKLSLPADGWETSPLRLRFMNAGFRGGRAITLYFGAKTLLAIALPTLLFLILSFSARHLETSQMMALLLVMATIGYYLPNVILSRLVFYRQRSVFENFPDAADLMLVCVESGLSLDAGLNKVADEMRLKSAALAEELQLVNLEMRAGSTREKALRNLAMRTGVEEVNTFATMLVQADRFGTSIGDSLRVFSDELRTRRRFRAEELAVKIPLKLLFPLVFFIFPSLLLVLLGPAFIQVYRILLPTMTGSQ